MSKKRLGNGNPPQLGVMVRFHADVAKKSQVPFDRKVGMIIHNDPVRKKVSLSLSIGTGAPKSKTINGVRYEQCELEYWLA